jgi:hypothetical protein
VAIYRATPANRAASSVRDHTPSFAHASEVELNRLDRLHHLELRICRTA